MARTERLELAVEQLGYRGTSGYVDGTEREVGARDYVWRDLLDKCDVDAAYFRGAVPLVAFYGADTDDEVNVAHRRLWNFGRVPVLIATTPSQVLALSCVTPPSRDPSAGGPILRSSRSQQPLNTVLREFTRFSVESGRAASEHRSSFDRRLRVDYRLLDNLRSLRTRLLRSGLNTTDVERLLGRSIFIRYMEDRQILSEDHLLELGSFHSFFQTLAAGPVATASLFDALADHFNGDVFRRDSSEKSLPAQAVADLADFFNATDMQTGQGSLWPYDFSVIPPELISSIYEQLLVETQQEDSAYYTPRHVVDLILDELLSWQGEITYPSILDPACGSGIFLAEAFRRLAYRHSIANGDSPTFDRLSALLTSSMYGVDKSAVAIGVAAFSLYLALLEHVDPRTAWREARLPVLVGQNLVESDFFAEHSLATRRFDLIVGNPPWKSALSRSARSYVENRNLEVPDQQIALAFLWRASELVDQHGAMGLVLPAKSLLHNQSRRAEHARHAIFNKLNVETVVDLSPVRRETFGAATEPASIAIVRGLRTNQGLSGTVHVSPRRTPLAEAIDGIVVSQDNIRHVTQSLATTTTTVWKTYLWGGPADLDLITRLRETFPSLEVVTNKNQWLSGQGFQAAGGDENDSSEIVGMKLLRTTSVAAMHLTSVPSAVVRDTVMHRPRNPRLYRAPHVVMRKGFREFPVSVFLDFDVAFTDGLFALAGPPQDTLELRVISGFLNSSVARYWFFMTSSSWGVEREQIQISEFMSLPIPPISGSARDDLVSAVHHASTEPSATADYMKLLDSAAYRAYGLTSAEQDLVREGLGIRLDEYRHGADSIAFQAPRAAELVAYCRLIASHLNSIESVEWSAELVERSAGFAMVACRATRGHMTEQMTQFSLQGLTAATDSSLDEGWRSPAAVMQPSVIVVEGRTVFIVKPDQRRSWTRSTARSDAGEVLSAILMAPASREI